MCTAGRPREDHIDYDDPELRERLEARMFRVQASHEAAILLRNALASHAPDGRLWTNRHPGSDDFHLEIDQVAAARLLQALTTTTTTTREGHTPMTTTAQEETGTTDQEQYELLEAVVEGLRKLK